MTLSLLMTWYLAYYCQLCRQSIFIFSYIKYANIRIHVRRDLGNNKLNI